jgi:choline/glycine/proline betaine transport protein
MNKANRPEPPVAPAIPQSRLWIFPRINRNVFITSAILILGFIVLGAAFSERANTVFTGAQGFLTDYAGWALIIGVNLLLVFVAVVAIGPYGDIRLGRMDETPEYGLFPWLAMLFSAGVGIGLIYWGVAEPLYHYANAPLAESQTPQAARDGMMLAFLHWGFHAWAVYAVVALALAYFHFRRGLPLTIRSALYPLIGTRIYGPLGDAVDILAVFGTLFGIVTALGLGAMQINDGLNLVFGIDNSVAIQIGIIALITFVATMSVVAGLDAGIKRLSTLAIWLSFGFLLYMLAVGPALHIVDSYVDNYGEYLTRFVQLGTWNAGADDSWQDAWTIFYWAWWVSWSPFVGVFIARISRGRTIRQFLFGVMLLPCSIMFFWFTAFGGTALGIVQGGDPALLDAVNQSYGRVMFELLDYYPAAQLMSGLAIVLIVLWFVTSSDSGSYVIDMLTAGGDPDPPRIQRVFWATSEGAVAAILLLAGGLNALQAAAVLAGFPFAIVVGLIVVGLWRALAWDSLNVHRQMQKYTTADEAWHNMPPEPPAYPTDGPGRAGEPER